MNITAIKENTSTKTSLVEGDFHQAILDAAYARWQEPDSKEWDYRTMTEQAAKTYGEAAQLFVLLGKYNQQVNNGGHSQYIGNGFADGSGGAFAKHEELTLHQDMISLFRKYHLDCLPHGVAILQILQDLRIELDEERETTETCSECGGAGDGCKECDGSGEVQVDNPNFGEIANQDELDALDTRYYNISEVWMNELAEHLKQWFTAGTDPLANAVSPATEPPVASTPVASKRPKLKLVGVDGNVFNVMGLASQALRNAGTPPETIKAYQAAAIEGDYDHLLQVTMRYCDVN